MNNYDNNYEYNNYETNKKPLSHYIKKFLITFLVIIIAIFLLLWLFPTKSDLSPLYDKIFNENIQTMKEVAISYFTTERLPEKVGDTKKLTLEEMLEMKLLLAVKDKNGDMCDVDDSYVEITKLKNEYKMKVNLKCGDEEDHIIVYLGCYDYCLTDICEKKDETKKPTTNKVVKVESKHYCAVVNGKYYDNKGKVVTKTAYEKACKPAPTKHYCAVVNGKYYDNKGKVVTKTAYEKACKSTPTKHYCAVVNGKYYDNKGNVVTKTAYEKACKPAPTKHYCAVVNGKYYDDKGNVVTKTAYEKACVKEEPVVEPVYKYLYEKEVTTKYDKVYSNWSNWSNNIEYNPSTDNIDWGKHEYVWYEKNGYRVDRYYEYKEDRTQPIYNVTYDRLLGYKEQYTCKGYTYYISSTTNLTYKTTEWKKVDRVVLTYKPEQTETKRYVYVGMDYDSCTSTCTLKPYYIFDVYTRTITSVPTTKTEVSAQCTNVETTKVPIYGKKTTFAGYVTNRTLKEKTTYYYHKKERTLVKDAYTDTKKYTIWSDSKNDQSLISQGYKYTGTYKQVN